MIDSDFKSLPQWDRFLTIPVVPVPIPQVIFSEFSPWGVYSGYFVPKPLSSLVLKFHAVYDRLSMLWFTLFSLAVC